MKDLKITIIGGGNLGSAIAKGLVNSKSIASSNLIVADKQETALAPLTELGIGVSTDNSTAIKGADIVMLVIKPWLVETVMTEIKSSIDASKTMIITLAAGVTSETIEALYGNKLTVFAVMPNTAIAIGESMTCISSRNATSEQEHLIQTLFSSMGQAIIVAENMMGAATALASCGTAYALRYIRAASQGGVEIGFPAKTATQMVAQVLKGAAEMILQSGNHPEDEIDKVTTPGGITINGLNAMEHAGFSSAVINGITSSFNKVKKG